jgi:outer membrane protein assembly factor BamB
MSGQPPAARRRRPWLLPVALVLLSAGLLALPGVWRWADLNPAPLSGMNLAGKIAAPGCWLGVLVWFFASGSQSRRVKLVGVVVLLGLGGTAAGVVRGFDVYGDLSPILHFRWEPTSQDLLERHRDRAGGPDDLPAIDLIVDEAFDFPRYRGVQGDGSVIVPKPLARDWSESPPELLWRQPCGGGFSGFAVAGNVAITLEQRRGDEAVVCYDRATGRERWVYCYPAHFRNLTGNGPRSTPTIHDGQVISLGATGELVCLEGKTGKKRWRHNILEDSAARPVTWGMAGSPLVVGKLGLVIVNPGIDPDNNAGQALAAYRLENGERVWARGKHQAGYSSPQLVRLAGRSQVLIFDAGGLAGVGPATGEELWRHPWRTSLGMNIIQPLAVDDRHVLVSSEASNGCALVEVSRKGDDFETAVVWANKDLASKFSNPLALGECIYGLSTGTLVCLDRRTGQRLWRGRYYGHGQVLAAGGLLLVMSERGYVALVQPDPKRFRELARLEVFADRTWNNPAVAGGQLFVRNDREMACFRLPVRD